MILEKRIKECYVTKEDRVLQTYKFQGMNTGQGTYAEKRTLGKNPPGAKGVKTQRQSATGLAYKACFRWFS
jgi:hypothetical protein